MDHTKADAAATAKGINLSGRSFLKLLDFTPAEIEYLIDLAAELKAMKHAHQPHDWLRGKNVVLLFEKTSTRTRCSFEVGAMDLGMGVTYLDPKSSQMGKKESIEDTARVLGRMYDGIEYRGFAQAIVEEIAEKSGVPVWNGLTTEFHPTQMLADMLTVREHFGRLKGLKLTFMGDAGNNVGDSLMVVCAKLGVDFCACGPASLMPTPELVETCRAVAAETGSTITLTEDLDEGRALGSAHRAALALPGERRRDGQGRRRRHLHALPAELPRPQHLDGRGGTRKVRPFRDGGHRRGLRGTELGGLRRGREPHALDQGRDVRDPARRVGDLGSPQA